MRGQATICEAVTNATQITTAAIDHALREISLLREYCARVIADVVTGKLDVREAPSRLPEEPEALGDVEDLAEGDDVVDNLALDDVAEEGEA